MSYPDMEWDVPDLSPDDLERDAEQLLATARVLLPEYSLRTSEDELLRVTSAMQRLGVVFFRPLVDRPAQAIPHATIEGATEMQLRAAQDRLGVTDLDQPSSESVEQVLAEMRIEIVEDRRLTVEAYAQRLRAEADTILAANGVEIKAGIAHCVAESEAA